VLVLYPAAARARATAARSVWSLSKATWGYTSTQEGGVIFRNGTGESVATAVSSHQAGT